MIDLAINLRSEEASVSYPECILWAIVYPVSCCALIGMSHKLPPTLYRQPLSKAWVQATHSVSFRVLLLYNLHGSSSNTNGGSGGRTSLTYRGDQNNSATHERRLSGGWAATREKLAWPDPIPHLHQGRIGIGSGHASYIPRAARDMQAGNVNRNTETSVIIISILIYW